jgi:hypothetical protein
MIWRCLYRFSCELILIFLNVIYHKNLSTSSISISVESRRWQNECVNVVKNSIDMLSFRFVQKLWTNLHIVEIISFSEFLWRRYYSFYKIVITRNLWLSSSEKNAYDCNFISFEIAIKRWRRIFLCVFSCVRFSLS